MWSNAVNQGSLGQFKPGRKKRVRRSEERRVVCRRNHTQPCLILTRRDAVGGVGRLPDKAIVIMSVGAQFIAVAVI